MYIYSYSPSLSQISLKNFLWKVFFSKFGQNRNDAEKKIGYLVAILKLNNILIFFFRIVIFYSRYIYGANFIAKFRSESGFLRGVPWNPPWAPTGVKVPWSLKGGFL